MGDVVNLRTARKRKERETRAREADASRALHGRTKYQKKAETLHREKAVSFLDGHRRGKPDAGD
jgi:hypothetical protein